MGKATHRELWKKIKFEIWKFELRKIKFDYTNKWCMHNSEFILEIWDTQFLFLNLKIQIDHLILAIRAHLVIIKKKKFKKTRICRSVDSAVLTDHRAKLKEGEKRDKNRDLEKERKKNYGTCDWRWQQL